MAVKLEAGMKKRNISQKRNCISKKVGGWCSRFRLLKRLELSPTKFLKRIGKAVSLWRRRPSPQVSSSGRPIIVPSLVPNDTHTTSAIQDCIEFINSSVSLPTSNPLSANSC